MRLLIVPPTVGATGRLGRPAGRPYVNATYMVAQGYFRRCPIAIRAGVVADDIDFFGGCGFVGATGRSPVFDSAMF